MVSGNDTLKAIVHEVYGSPGVLELMDIEKPPIKDNEVLLRVRAIAATPRASEQKGANTTQLVDPRLCGSAQSLSMEKRRGSVD